MIADKADSGKVSALTGVRIGSLKMLPKRERENEGLRHFLTNVPVSKPENLKGQRIRAPGDPVWARSVEAMGATPIAMGWNDSYNALQSKSIDGVEAQPTASFGARLYEVIKYIDKTGHFQLANGIIVGEKRIL